MEELGKLVFDPGLEEEFADEPCPDDLVFEDQPFGLDFHPSQNLVAVGLVSGAVSVYRYAVEANECVLDGSSGEPLHGAAVRSVRFDPSGQFLLSTGTDMSLIVTDVATLRTVHRVGRAHESAVSAMTCFDTHSAATGDEAGVVKLWDLRQRAETHKLHDNEDYISDLSFHPDRKRLLATGGDGYLSVFNPRAGKLDARSDNMDDELLSVRWIKNGKFAVVGTQEGVLNFWKVRRKKGWRQVRFLTSCSRTAIGATFARGFRDIPSRWMQLW
jgi:WD40 repeat protein